LEESVVILFDSDDFPARDRLEAVSCALKEFAVAGVMLPEGPGQDVQWRLDYWDFGPVSLAAAEGTGFKLLHSPRQLPAEAPPIVGLVLQVSGTAWFDHQEHRRNLGAGGLMLVDPTIPYERGGSGHGRSVSIQVGYDILGLPVDLVRRAVEQLDASPVCELIRHHLIFLSSQGDALSAGSAGPALGAASADLLRALIVSAAGDEKYSRPVMAQTLSTRILTYLNRHLTDPELNPERIAAELSISLRQLYKVCELEGFSLEQRIIAQRLEGARAALAAGAARHRTIEAVARSWGFTDPSYFSRRFRAAYGVSPREWQRSHLSASRRQAEQPA
jgi:AraC-like DNA-binding protein